jgi:Asp-tRNA(Asn)/Glu-tRNA(Gln) amidotransferase A subunit family amidase
MTPVRGSTDFEVVEATVDGIHAAMRSGATSSRALVEAYLTRIDRFDLNGPRINSIVAVNPAALDEADRCDQHLAGTGEMFGPLHGIPVVVKDQVETAGLATAFGCIAFRDYVPRHDASIVQRMRAAGAVILAKSTMSDFATSWQGISSRSGLTANPYNAAYDPGGSSSGSGAAVAANLAAVGVAEDTGGSVRVPAAFNNLVGVRPTIGLVSRTGLSPLVWWQDTAGPVARTVRDAAILLDVLVGYDPDDPLTAAVAGSPHVGNYAAGLQVAGLEGVRIGVLREAFGDPTHVGAGEVNAVVDAALIELAGIGAEIVDIEVAGFASLLEETALYFTSSHSDMNRFLEGRPDAPLHSIDEVCATGLVPALNTFLPAIASKPLISDDDPVYMRKVLARGRFQRAMLDATLANRLVAFVCPTVQIPPPSRAEVLDPTSHLNTTMFPTNTEIAARSALPAVSAPAGFTASGLPVGLEIIGRPYDEVAILNIALAFEHAYGHRRAPAMIPAEL